MALKVGVVGMRGIGNTHAKAHVSDDLAELVAVCDVVPARADKAAEAYGVTPYYNLGEMLDAEDLDVVDVTTGGLENGSWHYEPVMEALADGLNVLVEKPLSHDIFEAREMVAAADDVGVYFGCNLNHYFTPPAERAMQYVRDGQVGELVYCLHKMGFHGGEATFSPTAGPRHAGFPYFHLKAFLAHPFSVMRHFCGDITHVQAFVDQPGFRRNAGDVLRSIASIHVRFANGGVGYLLSHRGDAPFGLGGWWSFELSGSRGAFCIENCIEKLTYWPAPTPESAGSAEKLAGGGTGGPEVLDTGITDFSETFPRRIHAFLEDVTNSVPREQLRASGRDALATLEYTWAVIESYEQGGKLVRPAPLPPLHGDPTAIDE